ncbi:hypothetical protein [Nocardia caishijiensis]|uniref:Uncharacterized protein n=1 Tax=Nocardia caishijiensis TaxID=184756 RepID=A0ABQ6YMA8_9NOCA|nr:hypothetical protein [Nocardia caishijiensis]KAF0846917.1 hypothetical protein FNL39_104339 [Nocardia caishijiensis]
MVDLGALMSIMIGFSVIYLVAGATALVPVASATIALYSLWKGRNAKL